MSGGHFDYIQYRFTDLIGDIENLIKDNKETHEYGYVQNYSNETINEFKKGIELLSKAQIYVQRIDWLISGDDGEETFHERLKEDLNKLENGK